MRLFYKRPLCLILCIMLGGFCFSVGLGTVPTICLASLSVGFLVSILVFKNVFQGRKALAIICLVAIFISIALGTLFNFTFYPTEHYEKEVNFTGEVIYSDHTNSSYSTIVIKTESIAQKKDVHRIMISDGKDELSGLNVGDKLSGQVTILPLRDNDTRSYYVSLGYSARGDELSSINVTQRNSKSPTQFFSELRLSVCDRLRNLTDKRVGDFLSALLTGERVVVDPAISLSFYRTGTTHILALSGAHLVILAYAVSLILKIFGIGKRPRTVVTALAVAFYVPFTGMSASVTRAGVMLLISSLIFLLARRSDGPTTLSLSLFLIIAVQPFAIFDIALWLSALATLGLLLLSSLLNKRGRKDKLPKRAIKALLCASLASVFAISASVVISLLFFDSFSVLALPVTLILAVMTEALIYLSLFGLIFGSIIPIKPLLSLLANTTFDVTEWFSKFEYALVPFDFLIVRIISVILVIAIIAILLFAGKKHRKISLIVITGLFVLMNVTGITQSAIAKNRDVSVFTPDERCNILSVRSNGEYTVIASGSSRNSTYDAVNVANADRITKIDRLILPSYTYYTVDIVKNTVSKVLVDVVMLPTPQTGEEYDYAVLIAEYLSTFDTSLSFINDGEDVNIGDAVFTLHSHTQPSSDKLLNTYSIKHADDVMFYISAHCIANDFDPAREVFNSANVIIVGGEKYAAYRVLDIMPNGAETIILGASYQLSTEAEAFLKEKGVSVEITDTPMIID